MARLNPFLRKRSITSHVVQLPHHAIQQRSKDFNAYLVSLAQFTLDRSPLVSGSRC